MDGSSNGILDCDFSCVQQVPTGATSDMLTFSPRHNGGLVPMVGLGEKYKEEAWPLSSVAMTLGILHQLKLGTHCH